MSQSAHSLYPVAEQLLVRWRGRCDYTSCWQEMKDFTQARTAETVDEIWLLEHHPVFTQGQNGKAEHVLNPGDIPVVQTDRGGQVTYHGPGQLMIYTLLDLRRKHFNIRQLVTALEQSIVDLLAAYHIDAFAKAEAPGVYVKDQKIASIGLRIRRGCSYHGVAFNISLDTEPFQRINPCGFTGLKMTHFAKQGGLGDPKEAGLQLVRHLMQRLGYTTVRHENVLQEV